MIAADPSDKVRDKVTFGLSVSKVPSALTTLIATARDDKSTKVRGQALFWLAQKAGKEAVATITNAIDNDPDTEVKKKAVFALSQLPKDEGVPKLMEVARNNRNPEVRKQAMFWLGQTQRPARGEVLRGNPDQEIESALMDDRERLIEISKPGAAIAGGLAASGCSPAVSLRTPARPVEPTLPRGITQIPGDIPSVTVEQLTTDVSGDGAIVTGIQHAQLKIDGELVDERSFVDWFVRDGGEWRLRLAVDLE